MLPNKCSQQSFARLRLSSPSQPFVLLACCQLRPHRTWRCRGRWRPQPGSKPNSRRRRISLCKGKRGTMSYCVPLGCCSGWWPGRWPSRGGRGLRKRTTSHTPESISRYTTTYTMIGLLTIPDPTNTPSHPSCIIKAASAVLPRSDQRCACVPAGASTDLVWRYLQQRTYHPITRPVQKPQSASFHAPFFPGRVLTATRTSKPRDTYITTGNLFNLAVSFNKWYGAEISFA